MKDNKLIYYLNLKADFKIGSKTIIKLKKYFGSIDKIFNSSAIAEIKKLNIKSDIKLKIIDRIINFDKDIYDKLKKKHIRAICIESNDYPSLLKEIADPPAVLYYRGNLKLLKNICIAIVGSRKYTSYGKIVAGDIAKKLAENNIIVVSGLALGIDAIAHINSFKNGKTIAVLPGGLDKIYPHSNLGLAKKIFENRGLLISEYPVGTPPYKSNFPLRNRIIAGLSLAIVVIEAAKKSGTLLTAKAAIDYNREVFAVPGNIYSTTSQGTNNLIKYGANILTSYRDIFEDLNLEKIQENKKAQKIFADNKFEAVIIKNLNLSESVHIDILAKQCGLEIEVLNATLVLMEMKGKVRNVGSNNYILTKL